MFVTIINDCQDENAMGRQATRAASLFQCGVSTIGIKSFVDIEGAGNIIDMLDACGGDKGVIMVNIAPRHGRGKKWPNGTPFGYFWHKETLIVSTIDGETLSLAKKFGLIEQLYVTDLPTVIDAMVEAGKYPKEKQEYIKSTQFRSYDYMPFVAKWVFEGTDIPKEEYPTDNIVDAQQSIWWIDNFGNAKTTILPEDIGFEPGKTLSSEIGTFPCFARLKDVPNDTAAFIVGSSGYGTQRFIEFVVQGKSAAEQYNLKSGQVLFR